MSLLALTILPCLGFLKFLPFVQTKTAPLNSKKKQKGNYLLCRQNAPPLFVGPKRNSSTVEKYNFQRRFDYFANNTILKQCIDTVHMGSKSIKMLDSSTIFNNLRLPIQGLLAPGSIFGTGMKEISKCL